jgi:hypothetical protein
MTSEGSILMGHSLRCKDKPFVRISAGLEEISSQTFAEEVNVPSMDPECSLSLS